MDVWWNSIHRHFKNTFHEFKVQKKVIITETFNIDFRNKFIKFFIILFFLFFFIQFDLIFLIYFHIYSYVMLIISRA